jgi:type III restriction enzyme
LAEYWLLPSKSGYRDNILNGSWALKDYVPDFLVRVRDRQQTMVILETKGYDPMAEVKKQAAERWVAAVNADGTYGRWVYRLARSPSVVDDILNEHAGN